MSVAKIRTNCCVDDEALDCRGHRDPESSSALVTYECTMQ